MLANIAESQRARGVATGLGSAGKTVLGHNPEYLILAQELGANRFLVPTEQRSRMTIAQRWAANQKFLYRAFLRGDDIILTIPFNEAHPWSALKWKIYYMMEYKGMSATADGMRLIHPY